MLRVRPLTKYKAKFEASSKYILTKRMDLWSDPSLSYQKKKMAMTNIVKGLKRQSP